MPTEIAGILILVKCISSAFANAFDIERLRSSSSEPYYRPYIGLATCIMALQLSRPGYVTATSPMSSGPFSIIYALLSFCITAPPL